MPSSMAQCASLRDGFLEQLPLHDRGPTAFLYLGVSDNARHAAFLAYKSRAHLSRLTTWFDEAPLCVVAALMACTSCWMNRFHRLDEAQPPRFSSIYDGTAGTQVVRNETAFYRRLYKLN